jgi:uncharacterized protein (TIGR02996 family)
VIPDSDEDRLVIADGLIECGDPRGELIRLQIQLARVGLGADEAPELVRRHDELIVLHGRRWVRELGLHTHHHHFRRGFVEDVAIETEAALTDELFAREAIRNVKILRVDDLHALVKNPALARVRGLTMGRFGQTAPAMVPIHSLDAPEWLESIGPFLGALRPGPNARRVFVPREATLEQMQHVLALPRLVELQIPAVDGEKLEVVASDPRAARLEALAFQAHPTLLASKHLAPRQLIVSYMDNDGLAQLLAWPPFLAAEELTLFVRYCDVEPLLSSPVRPRRLTIDADSAQTAAILSSPIVERVEWLWLGDLRPPPPLDPARLPRLVALSAAIDDYTARELVRSRAFPRLARVRGGDRRKLGPLDRAPL